MIFFLFYLIIPPFARCVKTNGLIFLMLFRFKTNKIVFCRAKETIGRGKNGLTRKIASLPRLFSVGKGRGSLFPLFPLLARQRKRKRASASSTETAGRGGYNGHRTKKRTSAVWCAGCARRVKKERKRRSWKKTRASADGRQEREHGRFADGWQPMGWTNVRASC